jgi:hypothetical protein
MPDTSHCCCGETPCTPCDPITITVTDSESGLPLKWASAYWVCNDVFYGRRLTNASGQTGFENICCNGDGYLRICRLCYDTQDIPFTDCPSTTVNVSLVKSVTKPSYWITNDTPYNNIWNGSAWVWDSSLTKIYMELTYQEVIDPVTSLPYNAWIGCGPIPFDVIIHGETYGGGCERVGTASASPNINAVIACYINPTTGMGAYLNFYWISSIFTTGTFPSPASFTDCFDWSAATTVNDSFQITSIYGVPTPPACGCNLGGAGGGGLYAPCGIADNTPYWVRGMHGNVWVIRTSDPTPS